MQVQRALLALLLLLVMRRLLTTRPKWLQLSRQQGWRQAQRTKQRCQALLRQPQAWIEQMQRLLGPHSCLHGSEASKQEHRRRPAGNE